MIDCSTFKCNINTFYESYCDIPISVSKVFKFEHCTFQDNYDVRNTIRLSYLYIIITNCTIIFSGNGGFFLLALCTVNLVGI